MTWFIQGLRASKDEHREAQEHLLAMADAEEISNELVDTWDRIQTNFDPSALDNLVGDGVNIKCVNSSDFVVGKQTNFNGPVTIINCEGSQCLPVKQNSSSSGCWEDAKKEEIVIRDKILSESASATIQKMANEKNRKKAPEGDEEGSKETTIKSAKKKMNTTKSVTGLFWRENSSAKLIVLCIGFIAIWIAVAVALFLIHINEEVPDKEVVKCDSHYQSTGKTICIYGDYHWGGRTNIEKFPMENPVPYVVVSETDHDFCFDKATCLQAVQNFQSLTSDGNVTVCNLLVGGDGGVYEDVGWNVSNSLTGEAAGKSINICLMGNFVDYPTYSQVQSAKSLIHYGVTKNYIAKKYVLMASNATSHESPISDHLFKIIKKWPRFSETPFSIDLTEILLDDYPIFTKKDWGGLPATSVIEMKLPVPYVVISHSVTISCYDFDACSSLLRGVQSYHLSLRFADIAYNFMVDSSGNIYEGRGWSRRNVAGGFINGRNLDINFIGDFSQAAVPTTKQLNAVQYLIRRGLQMGKIAANYSLVAANATFSTISPGKNVYEIIKNWPHFDPDPESHVKEYDDS